jgi:translocation and assembly module TamB
MTLTSEPPMDERDIVSFLATGRPLYEVGGADSKKVGGAAEAASVVADYVSQGLRRYLPPRLALDVFRLEVQHGRPGVTVGRYVTRKLFVTYGQVGGGAADLERRVDATYTLSPRWSVETQRTTERVGGGTPTSDNVVDILFTLGFR